MSDYAFALLQQPINATGDQNALWIVDENISLEEVASIRPSVNLQVMTNRFDLFQQLKKYGFNAVLNDYDFSELEQTALDIVYYRVSKEKAVVHHIVNMAAKYLQSDGVLYLAGYKNEGTKTYIDKATKHLGELVERCRGQQTAMLAAIRCADKSDQPLDDKNYRQPIMISDKGMEFVTKPGVYGWNKIDKGSAFLVEHLPTYLSMLPHPPQTVLDLGCGYGFLSVMAAQICPAYYTATDNNIAAVELCRKNFLHHGVSGEVVLDDCAIGIQQQVDLVLCNPPFHQGFSIEQDLTAKFVAAAQRLLSRGGQALFVVNSFIPVEKKAQGKFRHVSMLANNGSFKLIVLNND
ncbi:MAG: methyltransferase [Spongiibacteraceae bacterium]